MSEPFRVASIGLGRWARVLASAAGRSSELELVSCFTRDLTARLAFSRDYSCRAAASMDELLSDAEVDAVIVTVPNDAHASIVAEAAAAGKHVYVEKPIAGSMADGFRIATAVEKAGVRLMVGHSARMLAGTRRMRALLDAGEIGKVSLAEANFSNNRALELTPDKWRFYNDKSPGGPLIQLAIHQFDVLQYLLGPVEAVSSAIRRLYTVAEVPDVAACLLQHRDGPVAYVGSSWASASAYFTRLYGTKRNADLEVDFKYWAQGDKVDSHSVLRLQEGDEEPEPVGLTATDMYRDELEELARAVREGRDTEVNAGVALQALAMVHAALRSAEEGGRMVQLKEIMDVTAPVA